MGQKSGKAAKGAPRLVPVSGEATAGSRRSPLGRTVTHSEAVAAAAARVAADVARGRTSEPWILELARAH